MLGRRKEHPPRRERTAWEQHRAEREAQERNVTRAADSLAEEFRDMVHAPGVVERYAGNRVPAISCRIAKAVMEGSEEIESRVAAAVADVNKTVNDTLDTLQQELDELRDTTNTSAAAARLALENHLALASRTLQSAAAIRMQIAEFRTKVQRTIPDISSADLAPSDPAEGAADDSEPTGQAST